MIIEFKTVKIGDKEWMAENLNVDHYSNGDPISEVKDQLAWAGLKSGAWCYYDNNPENGKIYGRLYNWYAVNDQRGLAPIGWHVPSEYEWQEMIDYLGRGNIAGGKLKGVTGHWKQPNKGATNNSGFCALPGGHRSSDNFYGIKTNSGFWTSTNIDGVDVWTRFLRYDYIEVQCLGTTKEEGLSIRCVRD